jgi:NADH pyrophosphatase NudC (nudix superfamily)
MDALTGAEQRRTALAEIEADLTAWRRQHPTATLLEIEQALDSRLAQVRAELLNELAQASTAADWRQAPPMDQAVCPDCGMLLQPRGQHVRQVKTQGNQTITIERQYGVCPACGRGLFPPG